MKMTVYVGIALISTLVLIACIGLIDGLIYGVGTVIVGLVVWLFDRWYTKKKQ